MSSPIALERRRSSSGGRRASAKPAAAPHNDAVHREAMRLRRNEKGLHKMKLHGHLVQNGVKANTLARGIRENHTLRHLDLEYSDLGADGIATLVDQGLFYNRTLSSLCLRDSKCGEGGAQALRALLQDRNFSLTEIDLEMSNSKARANYHTLEHLGALLARNTQMHLCAKAHPSLATVHFKEVDCLGKHPSAKVVEMEAQIKIEEIDFKVEWARKEEAEQKRRREWADVWEPKEEDEEEEKEEEGEKGGEEQKGDGESDDSDDEASSDDDDSDGDGTDGSDDDDDDDDSDEGDDTKERKRAKAKGKLQKSKKMSLAQRAKKALADRQALRQARKLGFASVGEQLAAETEAARLAQIESERKLEVARVESYEDEKLAAEAALSANFARERRNASRHSGIAALSAALRQAAAAKVPAALVLKGLGGGPAVVVLRSQRLVPADAVMIALGLNAGGGVRGGSAITALDLAHNSIGEEGCIAIAKALRYTRGQSGFIGAAEEEQDPDAVAAVAKKSKHHHMRRTSVGSGGHGAGTVERGRPALVCLDLWGNSVGDAGATALAETLLLCDEGGADGGGSLTSLGLRCNGITDVGATALASALTAPRAPIVNIAPRRASSHPDSGDSGDDEQPALFGVGEDDGDGGSGDMVFDKQTGTFVPRALLAAVSEIDVRTGTALEKGATDDTESSVNFIDVPQSGGAIQEDKYDETEEHRQEEGAAATGSARADEEGKLGKVEFEIGQEEEGGKEDQEAQGDQEEEEEQEEEDQEEEAREPTLIGSPTLAVLDLSQNAVGPRGAVAIGRALRHNGALATLRLCTGGAGGRSGRGIGVDGSREIALSLAANMSNSLTELEIGGGGTIGASGSKALAKALSESGAGEAGDSDDDSDEDGSGDERYSCLSAMRRRRVAQAAKFGGGCNLRALRICGGAIGTAGCKYLSDAIANQASCPLTALDLSAAPPAAPPCSAVAELAAATCAATVAFRNATGGASVLAPALFAKPHAIRTAGMLSAFSRGAARLGEEAGESLGEALRRSERLLHLELAGNAIGGGGGMAAGAFEIGSAQWEQHREAMRLEAEEKDANDDYAQEEEDVPTGLPALALGLRKSKSLTYLGLRSNGLGPAGMQALCVGLRGNSVLRALDVGCNGCGDEGAVALARALRVNFKLIALNARGNEIGEEGALAIAFALSTNSSLAAIDLTANHIGPKGHAALSELLAEKKKPCPFSVELTGLVRTNQATSYFEGIDGQLHKLR